jgi:hypothetical protein
VAGNYKCWFDPSYYAAAGAASAGLVGLNSAGNAPIGNIEGPGYFATDFSLRKVFSLWKDAKLLIQGDAFNAFNKSNWSNPSTGIGGSLGEITGSNPPRQMQFGGKVTF